MILRTTDNNCGKWRTGDNHNHDCKIENEHHKNLKEIANCCISELENKNKNLLVFPQKWQLGIEEKNIVFELSHDGILKTNNIMGFIGCGKTQLTISSRFCSQNGDYFLHYMLGKVLGINVVNMNFHNSNENIHVFLPYLFPSYLQEALSQGLFKQYKRNQYNDSNVKGTIDINRHIKLNNPFVGKIAYTMREHSYDNSITQLIRHTIEHLRTQIFGHYILTCTSEIRACVSQIEYATPSYKKSDLQRIIRENVKPVNHPYFVKYQNLQKLCLMILHREKTSFGDRNEIYGLLFDGAWLWEEYLNNIIGDKFWHPRNKKYGNENTYPQRLFKQIKEDNKNSEEGLIYPDFISKNKEKRIIADAKYKPIENIKSDDYLQLLAYMYRFDSKKGFYIYPEKKENNENNTIYELLQSANFNSREKVEERTEKIIVNKFGLHIPQNVEGLNFSTFQGKMRASENSLKEKLV
jgi:5-methylcytosine-specific restriction endonuclease McrBC regulatory subunit McrC